MLISAYVRDLLASEKGKRHEQLVNALCKHPEGHRIASVFRIFRTYTGLWVDDWEIREILNDLVDSGDVILREVAPPYIGWKLRYYSVRPELIQTLNSETCRDLEVPLNYGGE